MTDIVDFNDEPYIKSRKGVPGCLHMVLNKLKIISNSESNHDEKAVIYHNMDQYLKAVEDRIGKMISQLEYPPDVSENVLEICREMDEKFDMAFESYSQAVFLLREFMEKGDAGSLLLARTAIDEGENFIEQADSLIMELSDYRVTYRGMEA